MSADAHPAWIEIDLNRYRENLAAIWRKKKAGTQIVLVVKDDAYGHGALRLAQAAEEFGPAFFAVATLAEGLELRNGGIRTPILILGERTPPEIEPCIVNALTPSVGTLEMLGAFARESAAAGFGIHLKLDSGMSRYGLRRAQIDEAVRILKSSSLRVEGMLSHFAMSDEADKTFAHRQLAVFNAFLNDFASRGISPQFRHICNSGGFLDLADAHMDLVRIGILANGIYPSKVCSRSPEVRPVMSVKARIVTIKDLDPGDHVGYGMRYTAAKKTRAAVLPLGYGAGFPRVRNEGAVLIRGRRAPIIGGVSMDAVTLDISSIQEARLWDVATVLGRDGADEIDIHELAGLKKSVSYDVAVSWQRLPRVYTG